MVFFKEMLDATKSDYLQPIDPDIRITIDPIHVFPEDRGKHILIYEADHIKKERQERQQRKRELGKLPDDLFKISFFLDTYNFSECWGYSSDGITFTFLVTRAELEIFIDTLEQERQIIVDKFAYNPEGDGLADFHR
ncbi:MAG: hypothetical protein HQK97_06100 [Nitrospirae bacterium]|nr:hypothetical protein [Nitrospirota bacterium]